MTVPLTKPGSVAFVVWSCHVLLNRQDSTLKARVSSTPVTFFSGFVQCHYHNRFSNPCSWPLTTREWSYFLSNRKLYEMIGVTSQICTVSSLLASRESPGLLTACKGATFVLDAISLAELHHCDTEIRHKQQLHTVIYTYVHMKNCMVVSQIS